MCTYVDRVECTGVVIGRVVMYSYASLNKELDPY